ncbi:MAG: hypothetical protein M0P47_07370 [Bacteroidales bacterium]|nr:hypothetical protein [Bacteroidales bacterium]
MEKVTFIFTFWFMIGLFLTTTAQIIPINKTFSSDTTIRPFCSNNPVYSMKMSGSVQLLSDSSLVRVVLIDNYSNHYLVYETYPLIATSKSFDLESVCDETCFLNGIIPDSLRIDLIHAFVSVNSLKLDTGYIANTSILQ